MRTVKTKKGLGKIFAPLDLKNMDHQKKMFTLLWEKNLKFTAKASFFHRVLSFLV